MNSAATLMPRCSAFLLRYWPWLGWLLLLPVCGLFHGLWRYALGFLVITSVIALIAFAVSKTFKVRQSVVILALWSFLIGWFYLNYARTANPNLLMGSTRQAEFSDAPDSYFDLLTKSIMEGRFDLGVTPSKEFLSLADPYDTETRIHGTFLNDASYYRGKYYIYFGITPVLTLFLPFYEATGIFFPGCLAAALFCFLGYLFSLLSLLALCHVQSCYDCAKEETWPRSIWPLQSSGHATLAALVLGMGNFCPFMLRQPFIYQIAIASGFCFGMIGVFGLLRAWLAREKGFACLVWLAISGASLSLAVGSRPTLIICAILPILLFYFLQHENRFNAGRLLAFSIPYCSYGLFLALYNYLRFGSPIEFGWKYQLNGDCNLHPVFKLQDLAAGLFGFLMEPPKLLPDDPYVTLHWVWPFPGLWHSRFHEPVIGMLWLFPPVILALLVPWSCIRIDPFVRFFLGCLLVIFTFFLVLNASVAQTARYLIDLLPYVLIPGLFMAFLFSDHAAGQRRNVLMVILGVSAIWCTAVTFFAQKCGLEGDLAEKTLHFQRLLKHRPDGDSFNCMTAKLLIRQNRLEEAIPFLKKALEFNPEDVVARHNLGKLLYQQGSRAEGIRNLEESLRLQSGSRELLNDLAWMLATAPEDSLRDGKRALELALLADNASGGNDPAILDTLAAAYAESGDYPRALETARRALELAERQGNAALSSSLKEEIARYESGMPCREPQ